MILLMTSKGHLHHEILRGKLRKYGIRDIAGDWIQSYLENRKQYSAENGFNSGTRTVTCYILQGSCPGPLPFIIYLNDFEKCLIDSKTGLYADDTQITVTSNNVENLIQKVQMDLSNVSTWIRINKVSANPKKTEYMIFGHPRQTNKIKEHETVRLNDSDIKRVKNTNRLGLL